MTKIGKEKNISGSRTIVLQIKEDGKKLDELELPMQFLSGNLLSLNVTALYLHEKLDVAHRKLKTTSQLIQFVRKHT
ncbi:hypothetical protein [Lutibacter sp.]|uniref:hypothetical protein n=1 Tax=Lutibacter sp. TaxID=1925666 RepID=UPI0034A01114